MVRLCLFALLILGLLFSKEILIVNPEIYIIAAFLIVFFQGIKMSAPLVKEIDKRKDEIQNTFMQVKVQQRDRTQNAVERAKVKNLKARTMAFVMSEAETDIVMSQHQLMFSRIHLLEDVVYGQVVVFVNKVREIQLNLFKMVLFASRRKKPIPVPPQPEPEPKRKRDKPIRRKPTPLNPYPEKEDGRKIIQEYLL